MKGTIPIPIPILLLAFASFAVALVAAAAPCLAQAEPHETVVEFGDVINIFGGDVRVPPGSRRVGSVVSIGGEVVVEGEVTRDVVVILGSLKVSGSVGGSVTTVLSDERLDGARVARDCVNVLGNAELRDTAIAGQLVNVLGGLDRDPTSPRPVVNIGLGRWLPSLWSLIFWWRLVRLVIVFIVLVLLVALVPERIRVVADEAPLGYLQAFFVGLAGYLVLFIAWLPLLLTVVGLPLVWTVRWLGGAGVFCAVGRRLGRLFGVELSLLGSVLVVFALYALITLAPTPLGFAGLVLSMLLRLLFFLVVEVPAIGLLILTRAGGRRRPAPTR